MGRRVAITGVGVVSPIGIGKECFWESIVNGKSKVDDIRYPDGDDFRVYKGCTIDSFDFQSIIGRSYSQKIGRGSQLALSAAKLAIDDSGIDLENITPERAGVSIGTTLGESQSVEKITEQAYTKSEVDYHNTDSSHNVGTYNIAACISAEFGLAGQSILIPTACAAGNYAISHAYDLIQSGRADLMIAGGAEPFSKILLFGFAKMKLLASELCQPFDKMRKGLLVGEGSATLILEEFNQARRRGANIYGEILGYGLSSDAYHVAAPEPDGKGAIMALKYALNSAKLNPEDVQYISAHGTGTKVNDRVETLAIKTVFGSAATHIPVSSIKSMIGHTMGASSAIEAVLCVLALERNVIPPTINYSEPDPLCDLDYVPNTARDLLVNNIVSNSYGFFGNNASIVISSC